MQQLHNSYSSAYHSHTTATLQPTTATQQLQLETKMESSKFTSTLVIMVSLICLTSSNPITTPASGQPPTGSLSDLTTTCDPTATTTTSGTGSTTTSGYFSAGTGSTTTVDPTGTTTTAGTGSTTTSGYFSNTLYMSQGILYQINISIEINSV
uniref:Uncharacterized protein n=1 Tax=Cacopsylla melanoneura TaxID=428564 RepID=A0A8D8X6B5_9HEMI